LLSNGISRTWFAAGRAPGARRLVGSWMRSSLAVYKKGAMKVVRRLVA
jgi:hypothetical protein